LCVQRSSYSLPPDLSLTRHVLAQPRSQYRSSSDGFVGFAAWSFDADASALRSGFASAESDTRSGGGNGPVGPALARRRPAVVKHGQDADPWPTWCAGRFGRAEDGHRQAEQYG
jgi:hypothetical protein